MGFFEAIVDRSVHLAARAAVSPTPVPTGSSGGPAPFGPDGSAEQNTGLHRAVVAKLLANGGNVPAEMNA